MSVITILDIKSGQGVLLSRIEYAIGKELHLIDTLFKTFFELTNNILVS